jgi:hypothetical protein
MDRLVDPADGRGPVDDGVPTDDSGTPDSDTDDSGSTTKGESEDIESEDIESELYSSTREAGVGAVSFEPDTDSGTDADT